jgi:hypothetical protein
MVPLRMLRNAAQLRTATNFSYGSAYRISLKLPSKLKSGLADHAIVLVDLCNLSGSNSSGQPADRRIYNCKSGR